MGLAIVFKFADGTSEDVCMCYSSFSRKVMTIDDMIKWDFNDCEGTYSGPALEFLIDRLIASGYLFKKYDPMPIKATFC